MPYLNQADALPPELQSHEVAPEGFEPSTFRLVSNAIMNRRNAFFLALLYKYNIFNIECQDQM
jgi:hypothetical protein